MELVDGA